MNEATAVPNGNGTNGTTNGQSTAIVVPRMEKLQEFFDKARAGIQAVMPKHLDVERLLRVAFNVYLLKPELADCSPISMLRSTIQCAELGLDPSPLLSEVAFVPFKNKKRVKDGNHWKEEWVREVQLMPMYLGLIKLALQSGRVANVYAGLVDVSEKAARFNEHGKLVFGFHCQRGTNPRIDHVPNFEIPDAKRQLYLAYGVVKFTNRTRHFEILQPYDIEKARAASAQANNPDGPWVKWPDAMIRKTAIRAVLKTVPKSPQLGEALGADNDVDLGRRFSSELGEKVDRALDGLEEETQTGPQPATALPESRTNALAARLGATPTTKDKQETGK